MNLDFVKQTWQHFKGTAKRTEVTSKQVQHKNYWNKKKNFQRSAIKRGKWALRKLNKQDHVEINTSIRKHSKYQWTKVLHNSL